MILICIGKTLVPRTAANVILWRLYREPYRPIDAAKILGVKDKAAVMRITRAADALGRYSPRLAVALRFHTHWRGGIATYTPKI